MIFVKYRLLPLLIRGSLVQAHPGAHEKESYGFVTLFFCFPSEHIYVIY